MKSFIISFTFFVNLVAVLNIFMAFAVIKATQFKKDFFFKKNVILLKNQKPWIKSQQIFKPGLDYLGSIKNKIDLISSSLEYHKDCNVKGGTREDYFQFKNYLQIIICSLFSYSVKRDLS